MQRALYMPLGRRKILTLFACFSFAIASTQSVTITGNVVSDEDNLPMVGVTVVIDGDENSGAITDIDGNFTIEAEIGDVLVFNYIGYAEQRVAIKDDSPLNVVMQSQAHLLNEIVVLGYGQTTKSDLTGSVSSLKSEDLSKTTITTLEQGLQGRVAGVNVTQGDAAPGAGISIQIRGTNSILGGNEPLYVIDGIPVTNPAASQGDLGASEPNNQILSNTNVLATLSPSDIESIEILKDASATAIYGSRGANGVVIVTTKKGQKGKGRISLNTSVGFAEAINKIDLLDAEQFMNYQNSAYANAGLPLESWPWLPDTVQNPTKATIGEVLALRPDVEVDWQDKVYRKAMIQDYQLTFSGGNDKGNYSVLLNYLDQEGVIRGSEFQRGGIRTNLSYQVLDRVRLTANLAVTRSRNSLVRTSTNTTQTAGGIVRSVLNYTPIRSVQRNMDGELEIVGGTEDDPRLEDPQYFLLFGANPLRYTDEVTESHNFTRIIGGINATIDIWNGISADIRVAGNYIDRKNNTYYPRTVPEGFGLNGLAVVSSNEFTNIINENLLRYQKEFSSSRINAVAGFTYESNRDYWINNEARDFPDDVLSYFALQNGLSHVPTRTNTATWKLASFLGRVDYSLLDKYLITGTFRYDGSSKFAENNKWAPFFSVATGWRISQEDFLKDSDVIYNLKLRLSYGQSGNQAISPYQSLSTIQGVTTSFNNVLVPAVVEGRLENNNLQWETTTQFNVGVDLDLWNGYLFSTFNYYNKNTEDLLQQITLAPNTGFANALINSGTIRNRGFEVEIGGFPLRGGFTWEVSGNLSINRNEIVDLGEIERQFADRLGAGDGLTVFPFIQEVGLPVGAIYGFQEDGIFQNEQEVEDYIDIQPDAEIGQIRYVDLNGDGFINDNDRTIIGDVNPDFIWGINNTFSWKGLDFSFLFQGVAGADIINTLNIRFHNLDGRRNIPQAIYEAAWTGEGTSDNFRQINLNNGNSRFSERFVEDGSYVRLKNVQLGYNFNTETITWLQQARVFVNAINVWTLTDYSGYDPEVSAFSSASMKGVDLGNYPQSRTFMFGLNVTF